MKKINEKNFFEKNKITYHTIEDILEKDEKILYQTKPKKASFILNLVLKPLLFVIIWLCFDIVFLAIFFTKIPLNEIPIYFYILLGIFFLIHLIPIWIYISNLIGANKKYKKEEYAFTSYRIIVRKGFITDNFISIPYDSIDSINLHIGIVEKICKVGDLYIIYKNNRIVLEDIADPAFIYSKLQKIALEFKKDINFPTEIKDKIINN